MNQTKVTVMLSIATGLAVISFKTPRIYKKIHWFIGGILLFLFLGITTFLQGYDAGVRDVLQYVKPEQLGTVTKLLKEYTDRENLNYLFFGTVAYMGFLYWLACEVIEHSTDKKNSH